MNEEELQQKIAEYYEKLPDEVKPIFASMQWLETLRQVSGKYDLNEAQIQTLGTETTLVLLGIVHLDEYEQTLELELGLSTEVATRLVREIDETILKDIRPELLEAYDANNRPQEKEELVEGKISEKFKELPLEVQSAVSKSNYKITLYKIAQSHKLNVYQMGILEKAVTSVMLGTTPPEKFEGQVQEGLKLSAEENRSLVNDINDQIFKAIREQLRLSQTTPEKPIITEEIKKESKDNDILKQAGIELMPAELGNGRKESLPISKFDDSFKIPAAKTEYTLNNISKSSSTSEEAAPTPTNTIKKIDQTPPYIPQKANPAPVPTPPPHVSSAPKVDPYRMPIE